MHILSMFQRWVYAVFLSIDLFFSAVSFGAPWETISARIGKAAPTNVFANVMKIALDWVVLHLFGSPNHCEVAIQAYNEAKPYI